jgi:hypothetical protein
MYNYKKSEEERVKKNEAGFWEDVKQREKKREEIKALKAIINARNDSLDKAKKPVSKAQISKLIKQIPDDTYSSNKMLKIINLIKDGTITSSQQFPDPSEKNTVKVSDVVEFRSKKKKPEELKENVIEEKPINVVKKRGRPKKIVDTKEVKKPVKKTVGRPSKEKIYWGIEDMPKGNYRHPSMKEAIDKNKVSYYGLHLIDRKLLTSSKVSSIPSMVKRRNELLIKNSRITGTMGRIKKELATEKDKNVINKKIEELKELHKTSVELVSEYNNLDNKLKNYDEKKMKEFQRSKKNNKESESSSDSESDKEN